MHPCWAHSVVRYAQSGDCPETPRDGQAADGKEEKVTRSQGANESPDFACAHSKGRAASRGIEPGAAVSSCAGRVRFMQLAIVGKRSEVIAIASDQSQLMTFQLCIRMGFRAAEKTAAPTGV